MTAIYDLYEQVTIHLYVQAANGRKIIGERTVAAVNFSQAHLKPEVVSYFLLFKMFEQFNKHTNARALAA